MWKALLVFHAAPLNTGKCCVSDMWDSTNSLWDSQNHNQCPISMFCCFAVLSYICCIFYNRTTAWWQLTNKKWQTFLVFCHTLLLMSTLILPVIKCKQKVLVGERLIDFLFIALSWVPFDFEYEHAHEDYTAPHPGPFSLSRWLTWTDQRCMVTNRWNEPKEDFNTNWNYLGIALTYSPLHECTSVGLSCVQVFCPYSSRGQLPLEKLNDT